MPKQYISLHAPWISNLDDDDDEHHKALVEAFLTPSGLSLYEQANVPRSESTTEQRIFKLPTHNLSNPRLSNMYNDAFAGPVAIIPTTSELTEGTSIAPKDNEIDFEALLVTTHGKEIYACTGVRTQLTRDVHGSVWRVDFSNIYESPSSGGQSRKLDTVKWYPCRPCTTTLGGQGPSRCHSWDRCIEGQLSTLTKTTTNV